MRKFKVLKRLREHFLIIRPQLLLIGFVLFLSLNAHSQWQLPCEDTTRKNKYYQCNDPAFRPVCGCNSKTYRNECVARNVEGVNIINSSGVCQQQVFEFDFYPNPSSEYINFAVEFFSESNLTIQIFDTYGKLMYFNHRASLKRYDDVIDVGGFKTGLYMVSVLSGTTFKNKKLIIR